MIDGSGIPSSRCWITRLAQMESSVHRSNRDVNVDELLFKMIDLERVSVTTRVLSKMGVVVVPVEIEIIQDLGDL